MGDAFGAVANLGGAIYTANQASSDAGKGRQANAEAMRIQYPAELQALRQDYAQGANSLSPYFFGGGVGNYDTYTNSRPGEQSFNPNTREINSPYTGKLASGSFSQDGSGRNMAPATQNDELLQQLYDQRNQNLESMNTANPSGAPTQNNLAYIDKLINSLRNNPVRSPTDFSQTPNGQQGLLSQLNQSGQVYSDQNINNLVGQQQGNIQQAGGLNLANLQQLQSQLGGINQNSQQGLQQLIQQSQGNNQNIQSLFNQQSQNQLAGNDPQAQAYANLLGLGQNFAQGGQDVSGFNQFSGAVGGALTTNQDQLNGIDQQTQALIDANTQSSQFEQDKALQDLNDQLSARGLANSQAGTEAIAGAQAQFARQRALDQAKIRQDALNTGFAQRQQALSTQGGLAGQGANILSQQGQLGNADLNARLRALDTSGNLAGGAGNNQSRGIADLIQLLGANQSGIGNVNQLQNQQNQQNAGFAQTNYGLNQQGINNQQDVTNQLLQLLQGNEQRNQQIGQQGFANRGAFFDRVGGILNSGFSAGQQSAGQAGQIQANNAQNYFNQSNSNRQASGQMLGQGFEHLNNAYSNYQSRPQQTQSQPNYFQNTQSQQFQNSYPQQEQGGFYDNESFNSGY